MSMSRNKTPSNHEIIKTGKSIRQTKSKYKSTYHVELRDGRPHGKILDTLSDSLVAENIDGMEINVVGLQYLASSVAESALRE